MGFLRINNSSLCYIIPENAFHFRDWFLNRNSIYFIWKCGSGSLKTWNICIYYIHIKSTRFLFFCTSLWNLVLQPTIQFSGRKQFSLIEIGCGRQHFSEMFKSIYFFNNSATIWIHTYIIIVRSNINGQLCVDAQKNLCWVTTFAK